MQLRPAITQSVFSPWQLFSEAVRRSCVAAVAREHWAGPLPLHLLPVMSLAVTFCCCCSLSWCSAGWKLILMAPWWGKYLLPLPGVSAVRDKVTGGSPAGFILVQLIFKRGCSGGEEVLWMSCPLQIALLALYWNGNTTEREIPKYWSRLWISVLGRAPICWACFGQGPWRLQRALPKRLVLWQSQRSNKD